MKKPVNRRRKDIAALRARLDGARHMLETMQSPFPDTIERDRVARQREFVATLANNLAKARQGAAYVIP